MNQTPRSPLRRHLLRSALGVGAIAGSHASRLLAQPAPPSDYKALVCIYLQGGNDGNNTLIPLGLPGYQAYLGARRTGSALNLAREKLLPIQPSDRQEAFGLHPSLLRTHARFSRGKLAVVPNMGMLVRPTGKSDSAWRSIPRPANLFSHSDQELQLQSADPQGFVSSGWGGRLADILESKTPGIALPALISVAGLRTFTAGLRSVALALPTEPSYFLFETGQSHTTLARDAAFAELLLQEQSDNLYEGVARRFGQDALATSSVLRPILNNPQSRSAPFFVNASTSIARQLRTIASLIEGRASLGRGRQVFFVYQWGYDTHADQAGLQQRLLSELDTAWGGFRDAMAALGVDDQVTSFTLSDFGRTLLPSGGGGSEHGWGNVAFVDGGAVQGGRFYGPTVTPQLDGPDDFDREGRWIPSVSLEQYVSPMLRWMDLSDAEIALVLPNVQRFPAGQAAYF